MNLAGLCYLNDKDLWDTWGGALQRGAFEAILTPSGMKDYIQNKSRLEHGTNVIALNPRVEERTFSISIMIRGNDETEYMSRYHSFIKELQSGLILLRIPKLNTTYKVLFESCTKYGNYGLMKGKFNIKFREPNPANRI